MPTGPGQFKLVPYLIKTGSLDSVIKQTIYEANLFNTENAELTKIHEDRNIIVVTLLQRIADIERERKENNDPGQDEEEEPLPYHTNRAWGYQATKAKTTTGTEQTTC